MLAGRMKTFLSALLVCYCLIECSLSVPTHRSDEKEFKPDDLSETAHYQDEEHDARYDHESFLGSEESREFEKLSSEESTKRLGIIFDKIDKNQDGQMSREELANWIKHVSRRYIYQDADNQWPSHNTDGDEYISWDEWYNMTYGHMPDEELKAVYDTRRKLTYDDIIERDRKRFMAADVDGDKKLNKDEYATYLHPEDTPRMRAVTVEETLQDMDTNKDGFVDKEEYINDLWRPEEQEMGQKEPDWVAQEREHFSEHRDKNGDGKMDLEELGEWILPSGYDYIDAEVNHLMQTSDDNSDDQLSRDEVLKHHDVFVGSQATEYGDALYRHDEF